MRQVLYALAFLRGDAKTMTEQIAVSAVKPEEEPLLLVSESNPQAISGHLTKARELSRRGVELAERSDLKEEAADWGVMAAIREAFFGSSRVARKGAQAALQISSGRDAEAIAALTLAAAGDPSQGQSLADALSKDYPSSTLVNAYWLPAIRAQIALDQGKPADAVELLKPPPSMSWVQLWVWWTTPASIPSMCEAKPFCSCVRLRMRPLSSIHILITAASAGTARLA